eukprot:1901182-Rhodomonas_salina.1
MLTMSRIDEKALEKTVVNLCNLFSAFREYLSGKLSDLRDQLNNGDDNDRSEHDALKVDLDTVVGIVKWLEQCHESMHGGHGGGNLGGLWQVLLGYEKVYGALCMKYEEFEAPEEDDGKGGGGMLRGRCGVWGGCWLSMGDIEAVVSVLLRDFEEVRCLVFDSIDLAKEEDKVDLVYLKEMQEDLKFADDVLE